MSTSKSRKTVVVSVIIAIGFLGFGALLMVPASQELGSVETVEFVPANHEPGVAVVVSKTESGGQEMLGFQLRDPVRRVNVVFIAPGDCFVELQEDDTWPPVDPSCVGSDQLIGQLGGLGISPEGDTLINVAISVNEACYNAARLGMEWSELAGECG